MPRLVRVREEVVASDDYTRRRCDKHGYLYFVIRQNWDGTLLEAKSMATGATVTLYGNSVEEQDEQPTDDG